MRVLLVDDHQVVREGLRRMLEMEPDIKVVGHAVSGEEGLVISAVNRHFSLERPRRPYRRGSTDIARLVRSDTAQSDPKRLKVGPAGERQ